MWILALKWIHVLAAMIAVGANVTYGIWVARASREPQVLPFILQNISLIDKRLANPCYGLLLLTGIIMAFTLPMPLTTPWLLTALVLYVVAALLGIFALSPASRRQRRILQQEGFESPAYKGVAQRSAVLGIIVTIDVLIIVFLMVVKPTLWG